MVREMFGSDDQQEGPTRAAIVDWAREVYDDLDFTAVRRWLEANPGRKAGGYLPVYVPREVLHATGFLPVGIHGAGDRLEIIRGDAFYQSYICHLPRSIIELAQSGRLDMLSAVLFPSTCDVIRNLSGMWKLLYPDIYVRYIDVPQTPDPPPGPTSGKARSGGCSTIWLRSPGTRPPTRICARPSGSTTRCAT